MDIIVIIIILSLIYILYMDMTGQKTYIKSFLNNFQKGLNL